MIDESRPFLPSSANDGWLEGSGFEDAGPPEDEDEGEGEDAGAAKHKPPDGPSGGLWSGCHHGFSTTGGPRRDVTRLGLLCGPVNGMQQLGKTVAGDVGPDNTVTHHIEASGGTCYRLFATVSGPRRLMLRVTTPDGAAVANVESDAGFAVLEPQRPLCTLDPTRFTIELSTPSPGRYAQQVWQLSPSKAK